MTIEQAISQLNALQAKLAAYSHASALIFYDGATAAPSGTAANRGQTLSILSEESYKLATGADTLALLNFLDDHSLELDEAQQRMVFLLLKDVRRMQKIPMEEYVAYQKLLVEADDVWHRAKETDDFPLFAPILEQIFHTHIRFAGYCAPEKQPYDYWLGEYEDGLTMEVCDRFFDTLRSRIVPLLQKITQKPQLDRRILEGHFPIAQQEQLSHWVMEQMGLDLTHCALATTEHPFTISLGSHHDVRITTHYYEEDFSSSLFSVIHEGGHALYDSNSADEYVYTVLDGGVSMGIHESQSRFYENLLGRSPAFAEVLFPRLQALFPEQMAGFCADDLYRALNLVQPSLIRTEADEVSYCLHVMVRYELEKQVMDGQLSVRELPEAWNRLYREYLGVEVPNDRLGVLQDSHWSGGNIGYFPSYALGSAYGAQLLETMRRSVDVEDCLRRGDFAPINQWNREHIWRYGQLKKPGQLLEDALGEAFDPMAYIRYLEEKYTVLYQL